MSKYKEQIKKEKAKEHKAKSKNVSGLKVGTNGVPKLMSADGTEMKINFSKIIHHKYKMTETACQQRRHADK